MLHKIESPGRYGNSAVYVSYDIASVCAARCPLSSFPILLSPLFPFDCASSHSSHRPRCVALRQCSSRHSACLLALTVAMSAPASTPVSVAVGGSAPLTASCRKKARHAAALQALRQRSAALLNEDQSGITITVEGKKGRSAIAIRDLPPGHELIHEASAGWVLRSDESSNGFCSECCREYQRPTYPPCCAYVAYCSNGCLIDASSLHIFICPLLSKIPFISSQTQCDPDMIRLVVHLVAGYLREQEMVKKNGTIDRQKAVRRRKTHI